MKICYLNGQFLPLEQATISPLDRGFLFADAVYEVIPVYQSQLFHAEQHLQRLARSLAAINLTTPENQTEWLGIINQLIIHNEEHNQVIYLQISRGAHSVRKHVLPQHYQATRFAYSMPFTPLNVETMAQGVTAITLPDIRWQYCHIKSTSLLANVLLQQQAAEQNAEEAILINNHHAVEGTSSNVFVVKNQEIFTHPLEQCILGGVTRDLVIQLARDAHIMVHEQPIPESNLYDADEIWITSSSREIRPVVQLNQQPVGSGKAGPLWHQMIQHYRAANKVLSL
ncbi:MAG: D-amino acid aminotransferase [Gammaproteobacteria bacterium]